MVKNKNLLKQDGNKILFIIFTILFFILFIYKDLIIKNLVIFKSSIPNKIKKDIKRKVFPYSYIKELEELNDDIKIKYKKTVTELSAKNDLKIKESLIPLTFEIWKKELKLDSLGKDLKKYYPVKNKLAYGIFNPYPGSAYLDNHKKNLFLLSSIGILGFSEINEEQLFFKQIENNIGDYLGPSQLMRGGDFTYNASIKDLKIFNDKIFVSLTREFENNCWNLTILEGEINYKKINFRPMFSPNECISSIKTKDNEFRMGQSGGRITVIDKNRIIFSVGDFRNRNLAQDEKSFYGKIIELNLKTNKSKIISLGHRNPQGLLYLKDQNIVFATEHGPQGGDEVNKVLLESKNTPNYGWPIASYGEHYGGKSKDNKLKYEKFPLHKSHSKYGFVEPIISFTPSIAISEIINIGEDKILFGSLKDKSIYTFYNNKHKKELKRIFIGERIRDIISIDNSIFLFLEDTASIGRIDF